jgi:hypothetical protein
MVSVIMLGRNHFFWCLFAVPKKRFGGLRLCHKPPKRFLGETKILLRKIFVSPFSEPAVS